MEKNEVLEKVKVSHELNSLFQRHENFYFSLLANFKKCNTTNILFIYLHVNLYNT